MKNDLLISVEELRELAVALNETDEIYVSISREDYIRLAQANGKTLRDITKNVVNQNNSRDSIFRSLNSAAYYRKELASGVKDSYLATNKDMHKHCLDNAKFSRSLSLTARLPR